jgi:hypothetical protein
VLLTIWLVTSPNEGATAAVPPASSTPPVPVAALATAPRISGLVTVDARSERNNRSPKLVVAQCPEGKQILGGAGSVDGVGSHDAHTILTSRRPTDDDSVYGHGYAVTAAATPPGIESGWSLHAWAFCADPVPGHHIVTKSSTTTSDPTRETIAACPAGQRVLGTGAEIRQVFVGSATRSVALQMVRAFQPGPNDVQPVVVQASEIPAGLDTNWRITAYATCADLPQGYALRNQAMPGGYVPAAGCPSQRFADIGAALDGPSPGWGAPGNLVLLMVGDRLDNGEATAHAWDLLSTSDPWILEIQAICV